MSLGGGVMSGIERCVIQAELPALIERLRSGASSSGVVSHQAFAKEAERLGLTTDEQRRGLREGLVAFDLRVNSPARTARSPQRPSAAPTAAAAPAPITSEAARRLAQARKMLGRYADADGRVSRLAHDGVVRLTGLGPAEARELTAGFPITRPRPVGMALRPEPTVEVRAGNGSSSVSAADAALAEAVRAARAVLEEDRWRSDPKKHLLKAVEEVGLAVLMRGGAGDLGRDLPKEEIAALARGSEGWQAHQCLVLHNVRLAWKVAQAYQGRGLDLEDLAQHGILGLMRAVRRFDATKGYKLSTYATWWIKQSIGRAIADEGTLIRLPVHVHEKVSKVAKAERKLLSEGRSRSVENVAFATGFTFEEVEQVRTISRSTDSLDRIISDDTALADLIVGPSPIPGPALVLIRKEFQARLRHVLEHLSERERHILIRRTGLDGDEPETLEEVGVVFGVTRERIRQIESKAKAKFRGQLVRHGMIAASL
ncbi:sigma-70 family RNA polymerase sigma factor [Streptomyces virginiae]|uniref:sigma-70 family RNA polymerase sigma factor n=1 Tax=Streptomyces virginiae TaxID=1961 RepID=UPI0022573403|nr:sigma-70 family RNA polymerase sigma factor [Streptomyces virginiae]MCX5274378.1 sigma-70 family RNA polymerase sigma factor [Streptomyces virginiae]